MDNWKIHIAFSILRDQYKLYFYRRRGNEEVTEILMVNEIKEVVHHKAADPDESIALQGDEMQALADALWEAGFKPRQGHGTQGQLQAMENHLNKTIETHDRLLTMVEKAWMNQNS